MDEELREIMVMQLELREKRTAAAIERAQRFKALKVSPLVAYRCGSGCLLLEAWNTPEGILWRAPSLRLSAAGDASVPGQFVRDASQPREHNGGIVSGERAGTLGDNAVQLLCRHVAGSHGVPAAQLRAEVATAQQSRPISVKVV